MYVDQVVPDREVRMEVAVGHPYPLHAGASSKAFLAYLEPEEIDAYIARSGLAAMTDKTVTDERSLRKELAEIRRQGYSISFGERQAGAASAAAPVLDHEGKPGRRGVGRRARRAVPRRDRAGRRAAARGHRAALDPDGAHDFLTRARLNARWASHPHRCGRAGRARRVPHLGRRTRCAVPVPLHLERQPDPRRTTGSGCP